jgi:hypothetical protein
VLPPRSAPQILSAEDQVAGCYIVTLNGGAQVLQSIRDDKGGTVSALKMGKVVCTHNFFFIIRDGQILSGYSGQCHLLLIFLYSIVQ